MITRDLTRSIFTAMFKPITGSSKAGIPPAPAVPVANFSGAPQSGVFPLTVNFLDTSSGIPTSWAWAFGDGATSTLQNPSRTYAAAGSYNVTLTVTNGLGSNGITKNAYVVVSAAPVAPVANFTGTPLSGATPLNVAFTDTSTNTPTSWLWDFGDGTTSTSQNPSHNYTADGNYTVALTATNAQGSNTNTKVAYVVSGVSALALYDRAVAIINDRAGAAIATRV